MTTYAYIDIIPSGRFCAVAKTVGSTDDEFDAVATGKLTKEQAEAFQNKLLNAAFVLRETPAQGVC